MYKTVIASFMQLQRPSYAHLPKSKSHWLQRDLPLSNMAPSMAYEWFSKIMSMLLRLPLFLWVWPAPHQWNNASAEHICEWACYEIAPYSLARRTFCLCKWACLQLSILSVAIPETLSRNLTANTFTMFGSSVYEIPVLNQNVCWNSKDNSPLASWSQQDTPENLIVM